MRNFSKIDFQKNGALYGTLGLSALRSLSGFRPILPAMSHKPQPPAPILWDIYLSIGAEQAGHVGMAPSRLPAGSREVKTIRAGAIAAKSRLSAQLPFVPASHAWFPPSRSPDGNFDFAARAIGWECQVDGTA
jgi:hypothetical protein